MMSEETIPMVKVPLKLLVSCELMTEGKTTSAEISKVPMVRTPITMKNAVSPASRYP